MKGHTVTLWVFVVLAASVFSLSAADRTHYISSGDTLWDLSIRYYNTPFHWEDILEANPSIASVELLQPGSLIILPDIYEITVSSSLYSDAYSGIYTSYGSSYRPLLSRLLLETTGMVSTDPPQPSGWILETNCDEEEAFRNEIALPGDKITIDIGEDHGAESGLVYKIYEIGEEVYHPNSGEFLGNAVRVAGICSVIGTTDQSSVAMVEHAYLNVTTGQYLVPYTAATPITVSGNDVIDGVDAWVIAFQDPDLMRAYSFNVIYLDRGSQDGLKPGDIFNMYKYGTFIDSPTGNTVRTPDIPVSQLVILDTTSGTSAAMIYSCESSDLIDIGDRVELVKKQF